MNSNTNDQKHAVPQRSVTKRVKGVATSDGAGVSLTRIIGQPMLPRLDPFLMLDFFGSGRIVLTLVRCATSGVYRSAEPWG